MKPICTHAQDFRTSTVGISALTLLKVFSIDCHREINQQIESFISNMSSEHSRSLL